ncbi:MAG: aminotransferase class I/II-fold pyridoxal phosphate-dependent enzyme [Ruminococcus sp.]|nr:aminotransferase class I/II-fold pyridoxal phosphate-dependent enzyme [Ruminococcus sp.]
MSTPVYDFLEKYAQSGMLRCHMPGHKGVCPSERIPRELFSLDITEICGADSLFEAEGIIAESERNMSRLYNTAATVYSAAGSTLCIQAMLALMKQENRRVFAVRNVHRAFLNAAALLGIDVAWIMPRYNGGILSGEIDIDAVEGALLQCAEPACLYVTSPDYTGKTADIKALADICHRYDARLLIDNAHGGHLAFFEESMHPMALGADLCCDSAHKMLPALTCAALLHTSCPEYADRLKPCMSIFASTSPSYLIMASLDLCTEYIEKHIRSDISRNLECITDFKEYFADRFEFADGEPFHITIKSAESGFDGDELAQRLRANGAECEYSDSSLVILLMSPMNKREDYEVLRIALEKTLPQCRRKALVSDSFNMPLPPKAMGIREAVFSPSEEIPVEKALGRVCGAVKVPCPPAVPIAASGEIITQECINIFKRYGISTVNVVK